jgi:hypothetical protein
MLKSIKLSFLFCLLILSLPACKHQASKENVESLSVKPLAEKDIALAVFQMLKQIDTLSINGYKNYLLSYKDIKTIAADTNYKIGVYYRKDLKSITSNTFNTIRQADFQNLKSLGKQFKINWNKITYIKSIAPAQEIEGGTMLLHETHFSDSNNKTYFVKTAALYDGKGYYLLKVAEVEEAREK